MNISRRTKLVKCSNVFSTGTTGTGNLGNAVDMAGFEGCRFIVDLGATTVLSRTLQISGSTASGGTYTTLAGAVTNATTLSHRLMSIDMYRPTYRFLKALFSSTGLADTGSGIIAELYSPRVSPTTNVSTDVAAEAFVAGATT